MEPVRLGKAREGPAAVVMGAAPGVEEDEAFAGEDLHGPPALVDKAMMKSAEEHAVREGRLATIGPVADVMGLGVAESAAGKAASAIPGVERPSEGRVHDAAGVAGVGDAALRIEEKRNDGGIAGKAPRRFM